MRNGKDTFSLIEHPERAFAKALAEKIQLKRYCEIMTIARNAGVEGNDFKKLFNGYYNVRRSADWRQEYYSVFAEMIGAESTSFERILRELRKRTGMIEASFASKMLATIDNRKPVWDRRVISALKKHNADLPVIHTSQISGNIERAVAGYAALVSVCEELLRGAVGRECVACFDGYFGDGCHISDMKKLDIILWCAGD